MFLNISLNGATNITVIANFKNNSRERIYRLNCMALLDQVITPVMLFNYLLLSLPSYAREERNLQFCFLSSNLSLHFM